MSIRTAAALIGLALSAAPAWAVDTTLTFSGNICGATGTEACGNFSRIARNYGDMAGFLDVSHRSINLTPNVTEEAYLKYWSTGYSDLTGNAWRGLGQTAYRSEMSFMPTAGNQVTLASMKFGEYQNRNFGSRAIIYDGTGINGCGTDISSANGLVLR